MRQFLFWFFIVSVAVAIMLVLCFCLPGHAAEDSLPLSPIVETGLTLLDVLATVLTALLAWMGTRLATWLKAKSKNEVVGGMLARTTDVMFTLVREAEQTAVAGIRKAKEPGSPGGVHITQDEGKAIKDSVVKGFKDLFGPKGIEEIGKALGFTAEGVEKFLGAKVEEACLVENKARNP